MVVGLPLSGVFEFVGDEGGVEAEDGVLRVDEGVEVCHYQAVVWHH